MKVLVVDDSAYARHRIGEALHKVGIEVVEAASGEEAIKLLEEQEFNAATVDLLMPGMGGMELIRFLKAHQPKMKIIALSADIQQATQKEALIAGADEFISKNVPFDKLIKVLEITPGKPTIALTSYQRDVITELVNVAMGRSADNLSQLLNRRVVLRVPEVELMSAPNLKNFFQEEVGKVGVMVRQRFSGALSGVVALVFSSGVAERLIQTLANIGGKDGLISASQRSFLLEMGNIVLNAAISVLADFCHERFRVELPLLNMDLEAEEAIGEISRIVGANGAALVLVSRLSIGTEELIGYLIIMLPEGEVQRLLVRMG